MADCLDIQHPASDFISRDLERHITEHAEGAAFLTFVYQMYDAYIGMIHYRENVASERGRNSRQAAQDKKAEHAARYLELAAKIAGSPRRYPCTSYSSLATILERELPGKTADRIRRYLTDAAKSWFVKQAYASAKANPELSIVELTDRLMEQAKSTTFRLSRRVDIQRELVHSTALWYIRAGARWQSTRSDVTRGDLEKYLMHEAVENDRVDIEALESAAKYLTQ